MRRMKWMMLLMTVALLAACGDGNNDNDSNNDSSNALQSYRVVTTFHEPMTQPNDTIFTGTFTYDPTSKLASNLTGTLTQSMTKPDPTCTTGGMAMTMAMDTGTDMGTSTDMQATSCYGGPMTEVTLSYQLSAEVVEGGLLVTTFALDSTNTFDGGGFAPGGTEYYGLSTGATNPKNGGIGNAYAMIFVNTEDPTAPLTQAQIDMLAYADCTAGGMMMSTCMTGTTVAGYGRKGTMMGEPLSQVITLE